MATADTATVEGTAPAQGSEIRRLAARSAAASGVPEMVTDPTTLAAIARLLLGGGESDGESENRSSSDPR